MPSKLFILLKSPHEFSGMEMMKNIAGEDECGALLFEDAVLFAVNKVKGKQLKETVRNVYVIEDDFASRGLPMNVDGLKIVNYPEAVELIMERYDQTITL